MTNRRTPRRESFHDIAKRELRSKYSQPLHGVANRANDYQLRQVYLSNLREKYFLHHTYGAMLAATPRIMRLSDHKIDDPHTSERSIADAASLAMLIMDNAAANNKMVWDPALAENCRNACLYGNEKRPPETQAEDYAIQNTLGSICLNGQLLDLGYQRVMSAMTEGNTAYYRDRHAQDTFRNSFGLLMVGGIDVIANRRMIETQANNFTNQLDHFGAHARELLQ